jgi:hypothetical protein
MAGASLLTLLDDITTMLDDVSVMTKIAAKKTAGVLGDDLALNANQLTGMAAQRELPVVWRVAKGSFVNKLILVPLALLLSFLSVKLGLPWLVTAPLMLGGLYLCYEGVEKLAHRLIDDADSTDHDDPSEGHAPGELIQLTPEEVMAKESEQIKGAVRTDFILSAEIVVIALGTMAGKEFLTQVATLSLIAIIMTVGVYGLVGAIVKMDDVGLWLMQKRGAAVQTIGRWLVQGMPYLMRFLSIAGTAAMFLVGGGILVHNLPWLHHQAEAVDHWGDSLHTVLGSVSQMGYNALIGVIAGALALAIVVLIKKVRGQPVH